MGLERARDTGESGAPLRLTIAVLTYRRPVDIAEILPLLVRQAVANASEQLAVRLLVVDNDPRRGAAEFVRDFAGTAVVAVDYASEEVPGISSARNRALTESGESDLLVFIDDDERPSDDWLALLLSTWRDCASAAVVGPVMSRFETELDPWIEAGRFFVRSRPSTGTEVQAAATNNLLIDLRFTREHDIRFDLAFGISGGDDTMFTRELIRAGGSIVACDEAVVFDVVPAARATRRWVVLRAMSSGNSWALTSLQLAGSRAARGRARLELTARGGVRILGGAARFGTGVVARRIGQRARGVRTIARGAGMLSGAWGYKYLEYRRPKD
jgi:hypothetical protein